VGREHVHRAGGRHPLPRLAGAMREQVAGVVGSARAGRGGDGVAAGGLRRGWSVTCFGHVAELEVVRE
jgi:hypothetical protein